MTKLILFFTAVFVSVNLQAAPIVMESNPTLGAEYLASKNKQEMESILQTISAAATESYKTYGFYPDSFEDLGLPSDFMKTLDVYKWDYFGNEDGFIAEVQYGSHTLKTAEGDEFVLIE